MKISRWRQPPIGIEKDTRPGKGAGTSPPCHPPISRSLIIGRQEEHHHKQTYQDEYLEFLRLGGVEYDERYLW